MYPPREGDLNLHAIAQKAHPLLTAGHAVYLKWTCPACGDRVTAEQPLTLRLATKPPYHETVVVFPSALRHTSDAGCDHTVQTETGVFGMLLIMHVGGHVPVVRE